MSDCGNYSVQAHQNSRQSKGNSFHAKRSGTPDSSVLSSGQGPSANARPPTLPNNHHQGSQSHYQNHRPYSQRGRGGHYGPQNSFGSHSNNRRYSPPPRIPNAEEIVSYMDSLWQNFKKEFKEGTGMDLQEEVPVQQSFSVSQPPMSPRVPVHVNSPHRGQLQQHRYSHQNSVGSNWSVNSGVGGGNGSRRFSENGEHSNTGSLRRHHNNNRGGGNYNASSIGNQPWQRSGNFNNRQNSPNNTLNRQGQFLHHPPHYRGRGGFSTGHNGRGLSQVIGRGCTYGPRPTPRPVATTTPPVVSNVLVSSPSQQQQESVVTEMMESVSLKQPPVENAVARPQKPSAPTASSNGNGGRKSASSVDSPKRRRDSQSPSTTLLSSNHVEFGTATTPTKDQQKKKKEESAHVSKTATSDAKSVPTDMQSSSRRRAATTQGAAAGGTCSAPAVLTLSSFLPGAAPRHSESASIGSSSFCSLVDQVDVMSTTEQYFTPEPPSSPSSVSASVKATGSPTSINDR